jgi:ankyrin repeat protein
MSDMDQDALAVMAGRGLCRRAEELLKEGANPDARDRNGKTPLGFASMRGHDDVVQTLLRYGAKVNLGDRTGTPPLCWAVAKGHDVVAETLLRYGADKDLKDDDGNTARDWAKKGGHASIVKMLDAAAVEEGPQHGPSVPTVKRKRAARPKSKLGEDCPR